MALSVVSSLESKLSYIGLDSWMDFIHEVYGHPVHRFVALENDRPLGALSMLEVKHPVFGHYLATAPFGSYGGFAFENHEARALLVDEAHRVAKEVNAEYVSLRFDDTASTPPEGWVEHPVYYTYLIDLSATPDDLLKRFSSDHRNHIRKSLKKGFSIRFSHLDLLDDAYEALALSMHELGSPYHPRPICDKCRNFLEIHLSSQSLMTRKVKSQAEGFLFIKAKRSSTCMPMSCALPAHRMRGNFSIGRSSNTPSKRDGP